MIIKQQFVTNSISSNTDNKKFKQENKNYKKIRLLK